MTYQEIEMTGIDVLEEIVQSLKMERERAGKLIEVVADYLDGRADRGSCEKPLRTSMSFTEPKDLIHRRGGS